MEVTARSCLHTSGGGCSGPCSRSRLAWMSAWTWVGAAAALVVAAVGSLRLLLWRAARRRNQAGIPTSGRGLLIGSFMGRRLVRRAWLRVRMAVARRERRKELAARAGIRSAEEAAQLLGSMKG